MKLKWINDKSKLSALIPCEKNPRSLSDKQFKDLKKSLSKFDLAEIPVIDFDNKIVAGHQRIKVLIGLHGGDYEIDIRRSSRKLTDKEFEEYLVRSNKNTGSWDMDILANRFEVDDLIEWGFEKSEIPEIDVEAIEGQCDEDEVPEAPSVPKTVKGDLYELGNHRLLCGDSTMIDDVEKLMNGEKADMVFTDPPYGMNLDTDYSKMKGIRRYHQGKKHEKVKGDNEDFKPELIQTIFGLFGYCEEIFIWGADYFAEILEGKNNGSWLVWDKRVDETKDNMYGSGFELCWSKNKHKRMIFRKMWAGFMGDVEASKRLHPTRKPSSLIVDIISKWGEEKDLVIDLFLGSGSTLIACEKINRKCYGMELDEHYCDVIVSRYVKFTGNNKIKLNGQEIEWAAQ